MVNKEALEGMTAEQVMQQLQEVKEQRRTAIALANGAINASLTGDGAEVEKDQRTLTELEGQRSQLNARLELLKGKPPRCDEAYAVMNAAVAESEKAVGRTTGQRGPAHPEGDPRAAEAVPGAGREPGICGRAGRAAQWHHRQGPEV